MLSLLKLCLDLEKLNYLESKMDQHLDRETVSSWELKMDLYLDTETVNYLEMMMNSSYLGLLEIVNYLELKVLQLDLEMAKNLELKMFSSGK